MKTRSCFKSISAKLNRQPGFKRSSHTSAVRSSLVALLIASSVLTGSGVCADIAFVKTIGTIGTETSGTSLSVTVPATGVTATNSIIVAIAMNPASGPVSCSDSRGNSYGIDGDVANGSGTTGVRTVILSAHNVAALLGGDTITCVHPNVSATTLSANEVSGIAPNSSRDQTSTATGNSKAPSSGATPTTTQALELLFGGIGVEGSVKDKFTPGAGYTTVGRAGTAGGKAASNITINPEYRKVDTTGAFAATGTLSKSRTWAAAIVTYKAAPTTTGATIAGVATEAGSGIPIARALVEILQANTVTGITRTAADGSYSFTSLAAGSYDVRASAPEFAAQEQTGVSVTNGETSTINFNLVSVPGLQIDITSPANDMVVERDKIWVRGNLNALAGVAQATVNGEPTAVNGGSFGAFVPVELGANTVSATLVDLVGNVAIDTIIVIRQEPTPPNFFALWDGLKDALRVGNIAGALEFIVERSRERYQGIFNALGAQLVEIDQILTDITAIAVRENDAEFEMIRDGRSFFVHFTKDDDGIWRIAAF